jgi:hypothetical protein
MMDAQRQPTPQSGGMSQPSVSSPLASTRVPSMSSSGTAPGMQRLPTMFTPPSNSPDSGGAPMSGYGAAPMPPPGNTGRGQGDYKLHVS